MWGDHSSGRGAGGLLGGGVSCASLNVKSSKNFFFVSVTMHDTARRLRGAAPAFMTEPRADLGGRGGVSAPKRAEAYPARGGARHRVGRTLGEGLWRGVDAATFHFPPPGHPAARQAFMGSSRRSGSSSPMAGSGAATSAPQNITHDAQRRTRCASAMRSVDDVDGTSSAVAGRRRMLWRQFRRRSCFFGSDAAGASFGCAPTTTTGVADPAAGRQCTV